MSKLHFYRKIGRHISWFADGEGILSPTNEFSVTITSGSVSKGNVYEIRQGQSPSGDLYNCLAGASTGGTARFKKATASELIPFNEDFYGAALALRTAVAASLKEVTIEIAEEDLRILKSSDYRLCFAKKTADGEYNVVWQSYSKYLNTNNFSWTPQYQLFGTNVFQEELKVKVSTNLLAIGLGEKSLLDSVGILNPPKTGGPETSITLVNEYGSIHPGLNQLSTGLDGSQVSTPIYVAPKPIVTGEACLTPLEKVLVWFQQDIETSTMFSTARSNSVEIDLTFLNEETRLYKNQNWVTP